MIKIAIVEDETEYVETLKSYLARYQTDHSASFQIQVFTDGLDIVSDYTASYDIILLDIQMKYLNGMKAAQKIRELDEDVIFIFITVLRSVCRRGVYGGCPWLYIKTGSLICPFHKY